MAGCWRTRSAASRGKFFRENHWRSQEALILSGKRVEKLRVKQALARKRNRKKARREPE